MNLAFPTLILNLALAICIPHVAFGDGDTPVGGSGGTAPKASNTYCGQFNKDSQTINDGSHLIYTKDCKLPDTEGLKDQSSVCVEGVDFHPRNDEFGVYSTLNWVNRLRTTFDPELTVTGSCQIKPIPATSHIRYTGQGSSDPEEFCRQFTGTSNESICFKLIGGRNDPVTDIIPHSRKYLDYRLFDYLRSLPGKTSDDDKINFLSSVVGRVCSEQDISACSDPIRHKTGPSIRDCFRRTCPYANNPDKLDRI